MLSTGEIIDGKYRIVRLIGEGGMGAVYEGDNTRIHRRVAIKVLHAGVAGQGEAVARFEREAQAAGRIGSDHIVEVLDLGTLASGDRYMVMEFMDGDSLSARIRQRGRIGAAELVHISLQLLEGLGAAHGAGIIHRDLKPDNVFLLRRHHGQTDFVKLLDFGISKFSQLSGDSGFSMTRTGAVMGTPYYMSPEQAKGSKEIDQRVDIYAAGVILYECATGQVPFNADTFNELLFKIVLEHPRPLQELVPDIDPGFAAIVNKAMAREPADRFQSAQEFQHALFAWASGAHLPAPPAAHNRGSMPDNTGPYRAIGPGFNTPNRFGQPGVGHPGMPMGANTPHPLGTGSHPQYGSPTPTGPGGVAFGQVAPQTMGATPPNLGTGTPGSWENPANFNNSAEVLPKKSHTGLFVVLGVAAVLLLGGVGLALSGALSGEEAVADNTQAEAEKAAAAERSRREAEQAQAEQTRLEAERAKAEADAQAAAQAAERAKAEADAQAAAQASASAVVTPKAPVAVAPKAPPRVSAPPARPKATPAPSAKETGTGTSGGRKIRTSL